ncbi:MAG: hypothetical protein ACYC0H_16820 [Solirubrobacteraceae bacterium]
MGTLYVIRLRVLGLAQRVQREERGDSMVNWIVMAIGLALAAAAIIAILTPALESAAQKIVSILGG